MGELLLVVTQAFWVRYTYYIYTNLEITNEKNYCFFALYDNGAAAILV